MRLALVVRRLSHDGGTERYVSGLAAHAVESGHHIVVWCQGVDHAIPGVEVRLLQPQWRGRIGRMLAMQRAVQNIPRHEFDCVLGFIRAPGFDLYRAGGGCHAAWLGDRRLGFADRLEMKLDRAAVETAGKVVVNSVMAEMELQHHYGLDPARIHLVRNGVDLRRFSPSVGIGSQGGQPRLGFLGSGFARKGLVPCLRALVHIPEAKLEVAGHDRRQKKYEGIARRLGVLDRVCFLGSLECPEEWLRGLDLMVLPTRYDPCANACLEAMACGIPVVSSKRNGASELFPETWMAVDDVNDVEVLAETMVRALHTPGLGERCREAMEPWSTRRSSTELLHLLQESVI